VDLRLAEREREERTRRVPLCLAQRRRRGHCPVVFTSPEALRCQGNPRLSIGSQVRRACGRIGSIRERLRPTSFGKSEKGTHRTNERSHAHKFLGVEPSISPVRASCT
jgi:hypothetical protein